MLTKSVLDSGTSDNTTVADNTDIGDIITLSQSIVCPADIASLLCVSSDIIVSFQKYLK